MRRLLCFRRAVDRNRTAILVEVARQGRVQGGFGVFVIVHNLGLKESFGRELLRWTRWGPVLNPPHWFRLMSPYHPRPPFLRLRGPQSGRLRLERAALSGPPTRRVLCAPPSG